MKAKVLKPFTDKNDRSILYKVGQEIEISEERFKEINSTKNGKLVEEIAEVKKDKKK